MEHEQWDVWRALAVTLAALVLITYVVELYRQRHRVPSSSLTSGGIYTAVAFALTVVALLPALPSTLSELAFFVAVLLTAVGPRLQQHRRRVKESGAV